MKLFHTQINLTSTVWGFGEGITPHRKIPPRYEMLHRASELEGSCEHGNEHLGAIKGGKFHDWWIISLSKWPLTAGKWKFVW